MSPVVKLDGPLASAQPHFANIRGWLVGAAVESILGVLSTLRVQKWKPKRQPSKKNLSGNIDEDAEAGVLQMLVPGGLRVLGACGPVPAHSSAATITTRAGALIASVPSQLTDGLIPLLAVVSTGSSVHYFIQSGARCQELPPEDIGILEQSWLSDNFAILRCHVPVRLDVFNIKCAPEGVKPWPALFHLRLDALRAATERAASQLCRPTTVFLAVTGSGKALYGAGSDSTISRSAKPISLTPLVRQLPSSKVPAGAPVLSWQPIRGRRGINWQTTSVLLDVVIYARHGSMGSDVVSGILQPAITAQLKVMQSLLDSGTNGIDGGSLPTLRAQHVQPPGWPHVITTISPVPANMDDDAASEAEEVLPDHCLQLHQRLGLPEDRPLLRIPDLC